MAAHRVTAPSGETAAFVAHRLYARNAVSRAFFEREADRLAQACAEMAARFERGGRLIAFGRGACATDAQHVAVEFVHPVIVGKRALPALDLSSAFDVWLPAIVRPDDVVMGFAPPSGDGAVDAAIRDARGRGAQTFSLPGSAGDFEIEPPSPDPFVAQEIVEVLYHTLWETVHVFLEHRGGPGEDLGASGFLYPFLSGSDEPAALVRDVAASIREKAREDERLRDEVAISGAAAVARAIELVRERTRAGGTLLFFGNGGSATDANDWAFDCVAPPPPGRPVRAISLSMDPASLTAIANDVGREAIFLRQLIAHGKAGDVAVAISTSGGSANVVAALEGARARGLVTVALLGCDGGEVVRRGLADAPVVVGCDYIPRIQEVQASIYHTMVEAWCVMA